MLSSEIKTVNITDAIPAFLKPRSSQKFYIHTQEDTQCSSAYFNICKTQVFQEKTLGSTLP